MLKEKINWSEKIILYACQGLVALLPLFFLPWTSSRLGMDNFNKQLLLWLVVPILFFWQSWQKYHKKQPVLKRGLFFWPIFFWGTALFLSAVASVDKFSSFWGGYTTTVLPLFTFFVLVLFYLFSINFFDSQKKIIIVVKSLIVSYWIVVLGAVFIFSGALSSSVFFTDSFKLAVGSLEELSVYIAIMCSLQLIIILGFNLQFGFILEKWQKIVIKVIVAVSLMILLVANFITAWLILFFSLTISLVWLLFFKNKSDSNFFDQGLLKKIFWPLLFIVISFVFLIFNIFYFDQAPLERRFAQNLRLDYGSARQVALEAFKHKPIVGSGLETFGYNYSLWHGQDFNYSDFWDIRFDKSPSYVLEIIIVSGLFGLFGWVFLVSYFFYFLCKNISDYKKTAEADNIDLFFLVLFSAVLLGIIIGQIFFAVNIVLLFLFFLFLSLYATTFTKILVPEEKSSFFTQLFVKKDRFKNNIFTTAIVVFIFSWLIFIGFGLKYWAANFYYQKGVKTAAINSNKAVERIKKAFVLNPQRHEYSIALSKFYLNKGREILNSQNNGSINLNEVQLSFEQSIDWGQEAIIRGRKSVVAYENLSKIYRDVGIYLAAANNLAIETLEIAASLEPSNPVLITEIGKIYFSTGQLDKAVEAYNEALALKDDYIDAKFNLAKAECERGKYNEALALLEDLEGIYDPISIFYEEGRIFFNQKRYDAAIAKFKQVISLSPNHSNALYSLASAFQAVGEKQQALHYFKKVELLNPDNQEIRNKINELEK